MMPGTDRRAAVVTVEMIPGRMIPGPVVVVLLLLALRPMAAAG